MPFAQHAENCADHSNCCVIVGVQDGLEVWRSHLDSTVAPEARINVDHPSVEDRRGTPTTKQWRLANDAELAALGWDDEVRRRVAFAAANRGLETKASLAAQAKTTAARLDAEAAAKGWA